MLINYSDVNVNKKGEFIIPENFREFFNKQIVIVSFEDKMLDIFPIEKYEKILKEERENFLNSFLSKPIFEKLNDDYSFNLSKEQIAYLELDKKCCAIRGFSGLTILSYEYYKNVISMESILDEDLQKAGIII